VSRSNRRRMPGKRDFIPARAREKKRTLSTKEVCVGRPHCRGLSTAAALTRRGPATVHKSTPQELAGAGRAKAATSLSRDCGYPVAWRQGRRKRAQPPSGSRRLAYRSSGRGKPPRTTARERQQPQPAELSLPSAVGGNFTDARRRCGSTSVERQRTRGSDRERRRGSGRVPRMTARHCIKTARLQESS